MLQKPFRYLPLLPVKHAKCTSLEFYLIFHRCPQNEWETRKCRSFLGSLPTRLMSDALRQDSTREKPYSLARCMECSAPRPSPAFSKISSRVSYMPALTRTSSNIPSVQDGLFSTTITPTWKLSARLLLKLWLPSSPKRYTIFALTIDKMERALELTQEKLLKGPLLLLFIFAMFWTLRIFLG